MPREYFFWWMPFPCRTIQRGKMFLTDCIRASSKQSINLVAIKALQAFKDSNVTRLKLVWGMRWEATKNNIVFKIELLDFEGFVRTKTITNQHSWFLISLPFSLEIKHTLEPLQGDLRVGIPRFGCIMRSRGRECSPVAFIRAIWTRAGGNATPISQSWAEKDCDMQQT